MQTVPVLTIPEVAALCGVSRNTIHRWIERPDAPLVAHSIGVGRRVVYPDDLTRWAAEQGMILAGEPSEVARPWPRTAAEGV